MTHYTVLNIEDLQIALHSYGIEHILSYKVLSGGSENTNYFLKTRTQAFVLTISEQKSADKAIELAVLLEYLNLNNFVTSKIIKTKNGSLTSQWNNKPVMLKEYIEGEIREDLSADLLICLGRQLAQLHKINAPDYLPKKLSYGTDNFKQVKVYAAESSFYIWLKTAQKYIENHIKALHRLGE